MDPVADTRRGTAGYTLLEMLVVLAVIATATGISFLGVGVLRGVNSPEVFAHKIGRSLVALRFRALNSGRAQSARFDMQDKRVIIAANNSEVILPAEYSFVVTAGQEAGTGDAVSSITFLPDGSSSGAEISIANAHGEWAKLRVNWLTGLVEYADDSQN